MKTKLEFLGRTISDAESLRKALINYTMESVLYEIYMTQPLADESSMNESLKRYKQNIGELGSRVRAASESKMELDIALLLENYDLSLPSQRVSGQQFAEQRDRIAHEIMRRTLEIMPKAKELLEKYIESVKGSYYQRAEQLKEWKLQHGKP